MIFDRLLISGCRTDKNKLVRFAAEETQVAFNILDGESNIVHDRVEMLFRQKLGEVRLLSVDIPLQDGRSCRDRMLFRNRAIQQEQFMSARDGKLRAGRADGAGPTDKKDFH